MSEAATATGEPARAAVRTSPPATADEAERVRLAAGTETPPELLRALARDPRVTVRAAVALNTAAPPGADELLCDDGDERVRALLGRKLALLIPRAAAADRRQVGEQALAILTELVTDTAVRVRAAIADIVKSMPQAPRELILRLARDAELPVCEPVIRLSPLLSADDLLGLVTSPPSAVTAAAVARRANLDESVSDAIAASADSGAIAALLANPSAAIREATLDALVARAAAHEDWHDPLVRRPALSARAARALSGIVATQLLELLASRGDLPAGLTAELRDRLAERLVEQPVAPAAAAAPARASTVEEAWAVARDLHDQGLLDEAALLEVARSGDAGLCGAMLAVAAGVCLAIVERAVTLRSGKGVTSLCWSAGFSMKAATALQSIVGRIAPDALLRPGPNGDFPLAVEEMRWQIDLLRRMAR